ncbi:MAG: molybdopterin molybdotransferase MoeA [Candidatus Competibacter sp.]|nr:molybdopterin molybdotransferase MoeA [Candidatus Competibacter sp.]MDG4604616.1 molybdopterin molybdotransferase MoeA [Candidatus Contendobacter sp.]HRD50176.1 molybdopterin molybdotransferase MoeA [Candidatus Contendobacter sp.]
MNSNESCDAPDRLLTLTEAIAAALHSISPIHATETVPLCDAYGRVLAADLPARLDAPPYDNSAMDGFALHRADLKPDAPTRLPVIGDALAGHPYAGTVPQGAAVRITTGGLIPEGPDAVVMQEQCLIAPDERWIELEARTATRLRLGENIRRRGEDVRAGAVLLPGGLQLRPQDVALAAGQGYAVLTVARQLRVAVASTGDELHSPGVDLPPGAIYESNRYILMGLLKRLGCVVTDLGILRDDREAMLPVLRDAAATHDVLLTSGGVSVGAADWVKDVIAELGTIQFWRLAVKPGKPVTFGRIGDCLVLGLPGNPVSVMVSFLLFARPLLRKRMAATPTEPLRVRAVADFSFRRKPGRREWLRARLRPDPERGWLAMIYPNNSSGALSSLSWADGLIDLPEDCAGIAPGDTVDYLPFSGLGVE